jgi:hypothetical protein
VGVAPARRAAAIREAALGAGDPLSRSTREACESWPQRPERGR